MVDRKENYKFDLGVKGLTLLFPGVTKRKFLLTIPIHNQTDRCKGAYHLI